MRLLQAVTSLATVGRCASTAVKEFANGPLNYINGQAVPCIGQSGINHRIEEPATGQLLCNMQESSSEDIQFAVDSATKAQVEWGKLSGFERSRILQNAARILEDRKERIADMEVCDSGKAIMEARIDVQSAIDSILFFANLAPTICGQHFTLSSGSHGYTVREPLGVIGGIGAWNYPIQMAGWKSAPALACGNAMVFKPSQFTPLTAVELGDVYKTAGVPDGVYNVIQGGAEAGKLLCENDGIAKITFTGSVDTGKMVMTSCAKGIKYVTLELGGKSPLILFDDCNLKNAVKGALMANYLSQGQVCSNGTRVFIQSEIYDRVVSDLKTSVSKIKIGDPHLEDTRMGALINAEHAQKVLGFIERAKQQGAKVFGGEKYLPIDEKLHGGSYITPCIVENPADDAEISTEEVFGPVMNVYKFDTEEEVLQRANNTRFGLSAGVFTKDINRANRVVAALKAGHCYINNYNIYPIELPFGGYKNSGIGRENGSVTIEYFTQLKTVYVESNDVDCPL